MKIALLGDVHANLTALEAVLADAQQRGVRAVWNVGDFVGYGTCPDEVVRLLRDRAEVNILGNYDRKVLRLPRKRQAWRKGKKPDKLAAFEWAFRHLSAESRRYLASLPAEVRRSVAGRRVLVTHASPASEDEPITDETSEPRLRELAEMAQADVVIFGHSHRPLCRRIAGVLFVGTGSVGRPEGGDGRACYAVLEATAEGLTVGHYRVDYAGQGPGEEARPDPAGEAARRDRALAAATALGRRCRYDEGHTRQVTKLALRLFDRLGGAHGLGGRERFWLHCGALLHDIGWVDGQKGHHKTALRLILADDTIPLTERERRIVASVARYHRKALPSGGHDHYAALAAEDRRCVSVLAGILRVADGLDRTHADVVRDLRCEVDRPGLAIECVTSGPADAELDAARQKADLLALALGREVALRAVRAAGGKRGA